MLSLNDLVKWQSIAIPDIRIRMVIISFMFFSSGFYLGRYLFNAGGLLT